MNGNYFNPDRYHEAMAALGMRRRIDGWMVNATAGLGRQYINSDSGSVTKLAEIGVTSPMAGKMFLRAQAGYNQAAGVNGPSYTSRYVQGELVFAY